MALWKLQSFGMLLVVLPHNTLHISFLLLSLLLSHPPLTLETGCNHFLQQPPNVHSQQSSQRNPLWHLHHAPLCVCVCAQLLMKRDSLCWGPLFPATRGLKYSRWTVGVCASPVPLCVCPCVHACILCLHACKSAFEHVCKHVCVCVHPCTYMNACVCGCVCEMRSRSRPLHFSLQVIKI